MLMLPPTGGDTFTGNTGVTYTGVQGTNQNIGDGDVRQALQRNWTEILYTVPSALNPTSLASRRATNIANFLKGPQIPAPAWAATTAYVIDAVVTVGNGQHLTCSAPGTSAASTPVYGISTLTGRPVTDSGATWYGLPYQATVTDPNAPALTTNASAAGLGLTQINTTLGNNLAINSASKITGFGANLWGTAFSVGGYAAATGPAAGSGNATSAAVNAGQSASYVYSLYEYEFEVYITDCYFGIAMANSNRPCSIEVDGVLVVANGVAASGSSNFVFGFDYHGVVKRRLVRVMCTSGNLLVQGICLSPIGFLETTDTPNDTMLTLGDSINFTVVAGTNGNPVVHAFNGWLRRFLGLSAVWDAGVGGSGYVSQNANTFNVPAMLANPVNQAIWKAANPAHILIEAGCNDAGTALSTVLPAALGAWQATRALFPGAKITIMDGFPNATGPAANNLALAAGLLATFNSWNDGNSRFIQATSPTASGAWTQGTNNVGGALQAGNTCNFISTDGIHPAPMGAWYYGYRASQAIIAAWNGNY